MAKFCGMIGYGLTEENTYGVFKANIVEKKARGDILQDTRNWEPISGQINDDLKVRNRISIVGTPYSQQNFSAIRYVKWMGVRWKVTSVEVSAPRLILTIGGVYNGPTPSETP